MAESVDALVSNTSGATRAGSTPALGTRLQSKECCKIFLRSTLFAEERNCLFQDSPSLSYSL